MKFADLDINKVYTYADYLKWDFTERVELIMGKIFKMSPAPGSKHQRLSMNILCSLWSHLKAINARYIPLRSMFVCPGSQKNDTDIITVVQPDICVICDESKVDARGCLGAPDIVVEILSPSTMW